MFFGCVDEEMWVFEVNNIFYEIVFGIMVVLVVVLVVKCLFMWCGIVCSVLLFIFSMGVDELDEVCMFNGDMLV